MRCGECGGEAVADRGELVCRDCGLVLGTETVASSDYVDFTSLDHHERITTMSNNPLRSRGNRARVKNYSENRDDEVYHLIEGHSSPDHVKRTAHLMINKYFRAGGTVPSPSIEEFVKASLHISYRLCGMVPPENLSTTREVDRAAKRLKEAGIKVGTSLWPRPTELISKAAERLGRPEVAEAAKKIYSRIGSNSIMPKNVACACVYRALQVEGVKVTFSAVAEAIGANPSTVGKTYRELFPKEEDNRRPEEVSMSGVSASGFLSSALYSIRVARTYSERGKGATATG